MTASFDFAGKVVVVSGGAGGLGYACAELLVVSGATVVLSDLAGDRLDEAAVILSKKGPTVPVAADITSSDACSSLLAQAGAVGPVAGLVVAAGVVDTQNLIELEAQDWRRVIDIDLTASFLLTQAAGRVMQPGASIVLFSSVAGRSGRPLAAHYAAAKAGVLSLTKSAAAAFAPEIRVNAVCPGVFRTAMWEQIIADRDRVEGAGSGRRWLEDVARKSLLKREGRSEELAAAVAFLLSDASSFVTGQALNVDGGLEFH